MIPRLREIFAARTKGPWAVHPDTDLVYSANKAPENMCSGEWIAEGGDSKDAEFIACVGSIADEMLAVCEQADTVEHDSWCGHGGLGRCDCNIRELSAALTALREAVGKVR